MIWNCLISVEISSFKMKHPSATNQPSARKFFLHATLSSFQSRLLSLSQCVYTLYAMPFGPGADFPLAFLRKLLTSCQFGSSAPKGIVGLGWFDEFLHLLQASSLLEAVLPSWVTVNLMKVLLHLRFCCFHLPWSFVAQKFRQIFEWVLGRSPPYPSSMASCPCWLTAWLYDYHLFWTGPLYLFMCHQDPCWRSFLTKLTSQPGTTPLKA